MLWVLSVRVEVFACLVSVVGSEMMPGKVLCIITDLSTSADRPPSPSLCSWNCNVFGSLSRTYFAYSSCQLLGLRSVSGCLSLPWRDSYD